MPPQIEIKEIDIIQIAGILMENGAVPGNLQCVVRDLCAEVSRCHAEIARLRSSLQEIIKDIPWAEQIAKRALSDDKTVLENL